MIPWKQRLYAFLLRQVLGPLLDEASLEKLHDSIQVSFQEGTFALENVTLSASYLAQLEAKIPVRPNLQIRTARVDQVQVQFSLQQNGGHSTHDTTTTSLAWRAMQLGVAVSTDAPLTMSLWVHVDVQGVLVELEPVAIDPSADQTDATCFPVGDSTTSPNDAIESDGSGSSKGIFSRYVEAALASLRLSIDLKHLRVRLRGNPEEPKEKGSWMELHLQSASYRDLTSGQPSSASALPERPMPANTVILYKALDVGRVAVTVGCAEMIRSSAVLVLEGSSRISIRATECQDRPGSVYSSSAILEPEQGRSIQQNIDVAITKPLNLAFDLTALKLICGLMKNISRTKPEPAPGLDKVKQSETVNQVDQCNNDDELNIIAKQYREARLWAERNEIRGGLLVPSSSSEGSLSFDAFFDANEQSFYRYSAVLKESLMASKSDESAKGTAIVTCVRINLRQARVKLWLDDLNGSSIRKSEDFMLLNVEDCYLSSSISAECSTHELSLSRLEIEASHVVGDEISMRTTNEIESILSFPSLLSDREEFADSTVLQGSCLTLHVKIGVSPYLEVNLSVEPFELVLLKSALFKAQMIAYELKRSSDNAHYSQTLTKENQVVDYAVHIAITSISIDLPLPPDKSEWKGLYNRCTYKCSRTSTKSNSIGVLLEKATVDVSRTIGQESLSAYCYYVFFYSAMPCTTSGPSREGWRTDFLVLHGRTEINPVIPIRASFSKRTPAGHIESGFPRVPPIRSFKARQDDDEDDDDAFHPDGVNTSKFDETMASCKRELRGVDPQDTMIHDASSSDQVVTVEIPEMLLDLSFPELCEIQGLLDMLIASYSGGDYESTSNETSRMALSLNAVVERVSLAFHGGPVLNSEEYVNPTHHFTYLLNASHFKAHMLLACHGLKHARCLVHECSLLHAVGNQTMDPIAQFDEIPSERLEAVRSRLKGCDPCSTSLVFHRSHLFSPISKESPAIMIDFVSASKVVGEGDSLSQTNVYITIYDCTLRYDFESQWDQKAARLRDDYLRACRRYCKNTEKRRGKRRQSSCLTRMFVTLADFNIDYSTPKRFATASRLIVKIGDLRASSNFMMPVSIIQTYNFSVGDVTVLICCERFPYNFENSRSFLTANVMDSSDLALTKIKLPQTATSDLVLKAMNYRTVMMLDCVNGMIAVADKDRTTSDPRVRSNVTVGALSLFTCKDSFQCMLSTIAELSSALTALDDDAISQMAALTPSTPATEVVSIRDSSEEEECGAAVQVGALDQLRQRSALRPTTKMTRDQRSPDDFLLDGYDWTAITTRSTSIVIPPGEEQMTMWYPRDSEEAFKSHEVSSAECIQKLETAEAIQPSHSYPNIVPHHFQPQPLNLLGSDDKCELRRFGHHSQINAKLTLRVAALKLRFFDGYDWPDKLCAEGRVFAVNAPFVIDDVTSILREEKKVVSHNIAQNIDNKQLEQLERRVKLMGDLLDNPTEDAATFHALPIPEDRSRQLKKDTELRRLARRSNKYCQISLEGISIKNDAWSTSNDEELASQATIKVHDLFVAETISSDRPIKMVGEWVNEKDHPRETEEGLLSVKVETWQPPVRIMPERQIASDICELDMKMLPMRCLLDQRAIRFIRAFFEAEDKHDDRQSLPPELYAVPPPCFRFFRVHAFKMKVDYWPEKIDTKALRDGAFVELINISPIDSMVLTLREVKIENVVGLGDALGILTRRWLEDICQTQLVKFVANARPFEPITAVTGSAVDMVVLPWEAFRNGESIQKALRAGAVNLTNSFMYEACTMTSKIAEFVASQLAKASSQGSGPTFLPSRPVDVPHDVVDATSHAAESLTRALQTANYKIVVVPYREYQRSGAYGAVKGVIKGIPVALAAPASGAAEAISFTLLGVRNFVRPDIRKEEEASRRGLHLEGRTQLE